MINGWFSGFSIRKFRVRKELDIVVDIEEEDFQKKIDEPLVGKNISEHDIKGKKSIGEYSKFDRTQLDTCVRDQIILRDVETTIIEKFIREGRLRDYKKGQKLASQGESGDAAFFIICGSVEVVVNGRKLATREAKECVGEMPILDPTKKRMADLIAVEDTTVLRVSAKTWAEIFQMQKKRVPLIYNMAKVLADRLRDRSRFHRPPNSRPKIFIGSSTEAVEIAKALRKAVIKELHADVVDWNNSVFKPSLSNMESLEIIAPKCDFALMVLSGDDRISYRGEKLDAPRDNVIFELGYFMGVIGRTRSFFLVDGAKIPTDLCGNTYIDYKIKGNKIFLSKAIQQLRSEIKNQGVR